MIVSFAHETVRKFILRGKRFQVNQSVTNPRPSSLLQTSPNSKHGENFGVWSPHRESAACIVLCIYAGMGAEGTQDPIQKLRSTLETVERTSGAPQDNPDLVALKQIVLDKVTELRALRERDPRERVGQDHKEL